MTKVVASNNISKSCLYLRTPRNRNEEGPYLVLGCTRRRMANLAVSPMKPSSLSQPSNIFCCPFPLWLRWCSTTTLIASVAFLCVSLFAYNYDTIFSASLIPLLLVALSFAVFLNIYSFWHLRREHREADQAFRDTDCEFSSIFQNVLDGILIVDNDGDFLDANPAAAAILRCSISKLIGQNIGRFLSDRGAFTQRWSSFLQNKTHRGRAQLIAGDGTTLFVDFTATADYLPGRHVLILCDVTERTHAESSLRESEERFQHMANNIQEIFWMMDADTQEVTYVNHAYATITGHSIESLRENPSSYRELLHPGDRVRVLSKLREILSIGSFDEEFRFIRADGAIRWVWVKGFPVLAEGPTHWVVGTAQDVTSRKQAELKISEHLHAVEAARAEAEGLRKSTLALSQNLAMDAVLDTLLECISDLVPFDKATVLFVEDGSELMVAREAPRVVPKRIGLTFMASEHVLLQRVLFEKKPILLSDVAREPDWRDGQPLDRLQSWLGIPLVAAGRVLGILSLGTNSPSVFTTEHLRLAKSLAIPAAVAIQNARVHERAEIYASELELRLHELRATQKALEHVDRKSLRLRDP
jgi:PAS domain S-box-containing protein